MATAAGLPEELRTYLATCSAEHADQIIQALRDTGNRNVTEVLPANAATSMVVQTASRAAKAVKKQRTKKAKTLGVSCGPKRPLNSWMAFRKYYNASLSPHTQKVISKVLMSWWHEDPFSAKWAILAKAYSVLRGSREKDEAPLDEFLGLTVPLMGIVPPDQYQHMMGWQVTAPSEGDQDKSPQVLRLFTPNFNAFDGKYTTTTLSVDNLVEHCMRSGYLSSSQTRASIGDGQGTLTMAVQPATSAAPYTTHSADLQLTVAEDGTIIAPLSPFSENLASQLGLTINLHPTLPAAQAALTTVTTTVSNATENSYTSVFDPTNNFNVSFNPTEETAGLTDSSVFDAYDLSANVSFDNAYAIDWTQFVNDDGMA